MRNAQERNLFAEENAEVRLRTVKKTFEPEVLVDWRLVEKIVGPMPPKLTDDQLRSLSHEGIISRLGYYSALVKYFELVEPWECGYEERILFNVSSDLTGDISGLWGDASGITGRVNAGTTGNVTGLVGPMDNVWGDVSSVWGKISVFLRGTVTGLIGNLSNILGYCSDVSGDISGLNGNLTPFVGDMGGLKGSAESYWRYSHLLFRENPNRKVKVVSRKLTGFVYGRHIGNWSHCWGDASKVFGKNDGGFMGDVSAETGDVTGRKADTAFKPMPPGKYRIEQLVVPA